MLKTESGRVKWWVLLVLVFAGIIGYFILSEMRKETETVPIPEKSSLVEPKGISKQGPGITEEERGMTGELPQEKDAAKTSPEEDSCTRTEKDLTEFFSYLDGKDYIKHLSPDVKVNSRFKKILNRLAARPPVPAGEGIDPRIIIRNVYLFFRVLDRKDLRLIRELILHEEDSLEVNLEMLYSWLTLGDSCPDPGGIRPPMGVVYRYAGFFLNTIGGRAYLFRRPSTLRLLVSYYSILIVHKADKMGKNTYGIDIFPYIAPLIDEINHYSDLQFGSKYLDQLNDIESYYLQRR